MTDRLKLYNAALGECGERKLASLSESREPRRILDDVWDNGFINDVLAQGEWTFATRTIELPADDDTETQFGYANAFVIPTDHLKTVGLCEDERFDVPLLEYHVETGFWFADIDPIWVRYVSNDADYGSNLSIWPSDFCRWAEMYLAVRIQPRLTGSKADRAAMLKELKRLRLDAKSCDAMEKPTQFMPQGSWAASRGGRRVAGDRDRGSRSRLIG